MRLREFLFHRGVRYTAISRQTEVDGAKIWEPDLCAFVNGKRFQPSYPKRLRKALAALGMKEADLDTVDEFKPKA